MERCLVFNIRNSKEQYARSLELMIKLEKEGTADVEDSFKKCVFLMELQGNGARPMSNEEQIVKIEEKLQAELSCEGTLPEHVEWERLKIWFFVTDALEEDIVNLQFFALIRQRYTQCRLYIKAMDADNSQEVYAKASQFLQYVLRVVKDDIYYGAIFKGKRYLPVVLNKHPVGVFRNFSPLIEITADDSTLLDWQMPVEDLLVRIRNIPALISWRNNFPDIMVQDMLNNEIRRCERSGDSAGVGKLKAVKKKQFDLSRRDWCYQIFYLCMEYFCSLEGKKNIKLTRERYNVFYDNEFYKIVKDMPVLAFYIMCVFDYVLKKEEEAESGNKYDFERLLRRVLNARDMADGILQLIENVHHSEYSKGYFCFRIHTDSSSVPKQYLSNYYGSYMKERRETWGEVEQFYLEAHVGDFSFLNIPGQFVKNIGKRLDDKDAELYKLSQSLCLRSFFNPTDQEMKFWDVYNKIGENVVHHYGLQVFESLVRSNEGCFHAVSSPEFIVADDKCCYSSQGSGDSNSAWHIPGTQFSILVPFIREEHALNSAINADIDYTEYIGREYKPVKSISFDEKSFQGYEEGLQGGSSYVEWKEKLIGMMERAFECGIQEASDKLTENQIAIVHYDARKIALCRIEVFCKVIMLYLSKKKADSGFYMCITNCSSNHFLEIVRMFAVFYNKQGSNSLMSNVQIYLSGSPCEEFLLSGENIGIAISRAEKLSFSKGIHPRCLKILTEVLKKRPFMVEDSGRLGIIPFDMLDYDEGMTLFERGVKKVLDSDILHYEFGCRLNHTHIRLGSKIHMESFYEAELLFHNNYYISRFAYILAERLLTMEIDWTRPVVLAGYETYSEMLLYELKQYLAARIPGCQVEYVIYEQKENGRFRYLRQDGGYGQAQFILIVAINSTLTTHNKLRACLCSALAGEGKDQIPLEVRGNFALILVRSNESGSCELDDMEKEYWEEIGNHRIKSELIPQGEPKVEYLVSVTSKWLDPLKCPLCFPEKSMLEEKPLTETNKASVVPMQMIGIQEKARLAVLDPPCEDQEIRDEVNSQRVKQLKDSLFYRHAIRKGNHFSYYLKTEKYFIDNREAIIEWLKGISLLEERNTDCIYYDILIAPLHFSNTGFLYEVNHYVFHNAALVLHFDVEKEFRDNVRTKYSNLLALYQNLCLAKKNSEINFYFVDDTIISGNTFLRAKSLISGLFPGKGDGTVKVTVFSGIILLLSRMSSATELNYIDNPERLYCYVKLHISSMRNHEDACILCKAGDNFEELRRSAATNILCQYFTQKVVKFRPVNVEDNVELETEDKETTERAYRRMICSHTAGVYLERLGYRKNDPKEVYRIILELIDKEKNEPFEYLLSYLKVWSRPFLGFRKSTKEAVFEIMLKIMEYLLSDMEYAQLNEQYKNEYTQLEGVCGILKPLKNNKSNSSNGEKLKSLLLVLMTRLSDLGSNYIIRERNICKIFAFSDSLGLGSHQKEEFEIRYLALVKRICCLSSDENKSVYLEYLLLNGQEYREGGCKKIHEFPGYKVEGHQRFVYNLFFENTRVIEKAVANLCKVLDAQSEAVKNIEEFVKDIEELLASEYYYDSFKQILSYYGMIPFSAVKRGSRCELTGRGGKCLLGMVSMYRLLNSVNSSCRGNDKKDIENYYNRFLDSVQLVTGAASIQIMFPDHLNGATKYYVKEKGICICEGQDLIGQSELVLDTYCVKKYNDGIWRSFIKYKNYADSRYSGISSNDIGEIFMMLEFPKEAIAIDVYIGIKLILMFREQIVREFENDFGSNLMQKWISEQYFKAQMLKARSGDHTDKDDLHNILKEISKAPEREMPDSELALFRELFNLVINTYIARINLRLLADEAPYTENNEDYFRVVYDDQLKALLKGVKLLYKVEMCDREWRQLDRDFDENVMNSMLRMNGKVRPQIRHLSIIITELVRSAPRHGKTRRVCTYAEDGYLVVKNEDLSNQTIEEANRRVANSLGRRKGGISLAITKEFFNRFYNLSEEEGVRVAVEQEEGRKYFVVRLPIFQGGMR